MLPTCVSYCRHEGEDDTARMTTTGVMELGAEAIATAQKTDRIALMNENGGLLGIRKGGWAHAQSRLFADVQTASEHGCRGTSCGRSSAWTSGAYSDGLDLRVRTDPSCSFGAPWQAGFPS